MHCSVYIIKTLFSQLTVCAVEYRIYSIVNCDLYRFFIISCGLQSSGAYIFYFIERYRWRSVFLWLSFVDQIFRIRMSSALRAYPLQEGLWWTEGSCSGVSIINTSNAQVRERHECISELMLKCGLQSGAAYINF